MTSTDQGGGEAAFEHRVVLTCECMFAAVQERLQRCQLQGGLPDKIVRSMPWVCSEYGAGFVNIPGTDGIAANIAKLPELDLDWFHFQPSPCRRF
jgi:hypothetical protein